MSQDRRVLLLEFTESHHVLFHPQILALREAGYEPHALVGERFVERISPELCARVETFPGGARTGVWRALRLATARGYRKAVLNTANGSAARDFALASLLLPRLEVVGINHYIGKFTHSPTQSLISRKVRKYFVLSDIFREAGALPERLPGLTVRTFHPVFYPQLAEAEPPATGLVLVVPGAVQQVRRDYFGLLDMLHRGRDRLPEGLRIELVGACDTGDGRALRRQAENLGLETVFGFHEGFVSVETYDRLMRSAHAVLPLLHTDDPAYTEFLTYKVSGAYHVGPGYRLPYVMFEDYRRFSDFAPVSAFYGRDTLPEALSRVADPKQRAALRAGYDTLSKFSLAAQSRAYAELLEA